MSRFDWLTSRPIAHRGLHDGGLRIVENTPSAASAAIARGYGIEVDLQITADGEAMVHHDDSLGRLTEGVGRLANMTAAQLKRIRFTSTADHMMTLGELCDLVGGRTLLLLEMKSVFDGDRRLALRTAQVLKAYAGPVAAMSFDPALVAEVKRAAPNLTRGITAMGHYDDLEWAPLSKWSKRGWPLLLPAIVHDPHFVAYALRDLPAAAATLARTCLGKPLLAWVARSEADRRYASHLADQIIFEGFTP
jgi:glycerophosphoryl diester phosphodiesterase